MVTSVPDLILLPIVSCTQYLLLDRLAIGPLGIG